MRIFVCDFDKLIEIEDGRIQVLQATARVWSVTQEGAEVPHWHKYNLIPCAETGLNEYREQIWVMKSLVYEAGQGRSSEILQLHECSLYYIYELITLRKASEFNN